MPTLMSPQTTMATASARRTPTTPIRVLTSSSPDVDGSDELEIPVLDPLAGKLGEGGVAVLVEAPSAKHAVVVLGREHLPDHAIAGDLPVGVVGPFYGVEQHVGSLVAVGC